MYRSSNNSIYCSIYIIRNNFNNKVYIGQTWGTINKRFLKHKSAKTCVKMHNAIKAHGAENFNISLITFCHSQEIADYIESFYIKKYNSIENGYNLMSGGSAGKPSEEVRLKLSLSHMGIPCSEGARKKISAANKGKIVSQETRDKLSQLHMGIKKSEESKLKHSESKKGKNNPNFGKFGKDHPTFGSWAKGEDSHKAKINFKIAEAIRADYKNMSTYALAKKYNVSRTTISRVINNKFWVEKPE